MNARRVFERLFALRIIALSGLRLTLASGLCVQAAGVAEGMKQGKEAAVQGVKTLAPYQLESGLVTRKENQFAHDWLAAVAARSEKDGWRDDWIATALPFSFRYGGKPFRTTGWKFETTGCGAVRTAGPVGERELSWTDPATGLRLRWQLRQFEDYPAVEWLLTFENTGQIDTPLIEDVQALDLQLRHALKAQPFLIHGANGARSRHDDLMPFTKLLPDPTRWHGYEGMSDTPDEILLGGDYPSCERHFPFFNIETPERHGVLVAVGWSGTWQARLKAAGNKLNCRVGLEHTRFVLHPGEKVRSPRILLLFWEGRRLHGQNMLRQLLYKHYIPPLNGRPQYPMVSVNVLGTVGADTQTEQNVMAQVEPYVKLGVEMFMIDAGWYKSADQRRHFLSCMNDFGNWEVDPVKYPRGLRPISDRLSKAGIAFGMWFAPEQVSPPSPLVKTHADWILWPPDQWDGVTILRDRIPPFSPMLMKLLSPIGTLRLELPEARRWFMEKIDSLVKKDGLGCYRQDFSGWYGGDEKDRQAVREMKNVAGLYDLWDTLRERYPEMIMEGCCGGGRRIDLETLMRFHWHQKADYMFDSESNQCGIYGANLFLPGGLILNFVKACDDYSVWSCFAGQLCFLGLPLKEGFPIKRGQQHVARFKQLRDALSGDFYPLTPCTLDQTWLGMQFHRADQNKGIALIYRRPDDPHLTAGVREQRKSGDSVGRIYPVDDTLRVRLRGLEPATPYTIHFEKGGRQRKLTGEALARGIDIVVSKVPDAEIVTYRKTE